MSTWNIYHKDGSKLTDVNGEQITVHGLEYSDSWMGECFLTINFKHEVPINFQIGDYIIYRNERFELNYEPGKDKQARPNTYGEGFVYDSVKFNALQDELARAEFLDVVLNDNELHYTALPKFPFFVQTLDDLLDRIQANLDEQIGAGLWKIYSRNKERSVQRGCLVSEWLSMYGEGTSDNVIESMSITIDSKTCWEALALVNEKWNVNFIVRGRNIYVGTTGIEAGHIFSYGLGKGLYEIVQNADSDQSVITRLRAYGSEKNLPSHYYADLGVKYVANITKVVTASTNVELELDLDYIETYFKNKRKYVVSGESQEQSNGWVLQVTFDFQTTITGYVTQSGSSGKCRFYSEFKGGQVDSGDEESKEKLDAFISQVKAGNTKMYITSGLNKKAVPSSMKEYAKNLPNNMSINRLMLPGFPHVSLSDFYDSLTEQEKKYVNPTGKLHRFSTDPYRPYIDSLNIEEIGLRSASQFFDTDDKTNGVIEIYPTIEEMEIGGVRVDEIDEGVAPNDDGRFGDNETVKNVDIYLNKAIDFDINDLKDDDFSISMKDGMCGGRTFKVASSTKVDGRWRLTIERSKDDALELWFPYKDYPIKNGDHFVLTGITLPDSYVNAASLKLLKYAIALLDKNDYTRYVYQPKVDELFMARQHDLAQADETGTIKSLHDTLKAGDLMNFNDTDLNIEGIISIDQLTIKEEDGKIPTYDITLREDKEVGTIQKIQQQISSLQSGNGGAGAGLTTTQVKNQVATEGSKHFISKINDDTAKCTITWEKVQKLLSGLLVGNFNNENGGSWTPDAEGRSHLITDYLEVRMKAIFEELVVKKTSTIGGKEIISPAGGVVAHKVEEVTVTYNNVSQKAYRCYFLAEQEGDSVDNDFAIGDQVRSESFNVRKGTYHKVGNHFYWRLVIGRDEEPVELEGKKYHYIDLSDTDCATASDVPAKGDVLSQCGNRTDVERQNCLIFSAVDTYSPSISLYHGINSYSFANKEYVEYGVNKQTNKAFFNVYGDMYVGDRPTKENGYEGSSYIKYDSATKQVSVKGKISAKSTVDGKELSQYIKENSAKGLTEEQVNNLIKNSQVIADLQNQVDGAIETWFYEGVPTLKNAPASSWATDKEKDTHLGDLYYDNKTGKAYRFAKDGNTYKWTIITDTDIAKALSDASKAQETADGKMKVFSTQPIPPYQLGDIWVNATYPTDGNIYKNEILRCQTAKAKGSSFDIADWTKASKYTDDSALNTFKEEYKNDMASYKEQLDEKVETWFYNYAPTTQNKPASDWTTDTLKSQHAGDLFYNTSNGYTYRWTGTAWARIKDNDINTAMTAASKAQDTADGKRTVFTSQPTVPYDEGDLWASGGDDGKTLMVCVKSRATGSFTSSEWVKANDSDLNAFAKTIEESLTGIQDQLDKKAETWYQSTDPSTSWTTDDAKKKHKGDLWYNTSNNQTFFWNGTKWDKQDVPTEVFDKIDGKSSIYVSKPASYEERDLWILEAAYTLGGVAYSKGELVVATKSNASFSAADWTKKVKYTDDTVANAAKKAAEEAKKAADTAQTNVTNLGKTVTSNKKAFDNYVTDGYLEPSEIAAMAQDSKRLEDAFAAAEKSYTEVKEAAVLKDTKELTDLNTAFATLTTAKTELVTYLSDISARYNAANTEKKATIVSAVGTKFTNFQSAYSAFYDKLGLANAYITSKIYGDLKQNITDLAGYKYIKDALGQTTDIDGGLVMTTLLALRDADGNVQSGINGAIDTNRGKKSIATWWGGQMVDKDYNSGSLTPATSLVRFDGSGYLANGAIWWDVDGKVHADPTSFIISEKNLGAYLAFFEPTWKSGSNGTNIKDLVALTPQAPFTTLSVSNDLLVEGKLKLGSITLSVVNGALKIDGNVYSTGGMSAYGDGTNNGGGGGLVASVKSYTDIIKGTYTDNDLASIPNAYAIKALSNRIDNISSELGGLSLDWANITGKPSTFTPSAHTHKWVDITDRITKVSQLTNDSGYTTNKGTVTSVKLTLPTGLSLGTTKEITTSGTFAISLTSGYSIPTTSKQGQWDSAYNWYKLMTTDEETADGVINKWNEVVNFLAGIAQTDTLDGILSGINNSITEEANRAKKAEAANATNIATNKANITTLQGYFTNGSAKSAIKLTNARKLWGNSFDGTADISGSIVVPSGKYITIGNIKLEYDATNKALKITNTSTNEVANLYTSGGVSAYGVGTTSSGSTGGGGLNGTVKSYNDAKSLTSESLSEVASAYSVAALYSSINDAIGRINTLEGGSATNIEVTGSGNAVTGVSKSGTKLTFTKGATFLTSHQDISGKSDKTHTHSVKINGVTKTIAATGGTAVDLGTYLTSHQSLAAYLKSADAEKTYSKLGHTHAFSEITGKPTTLAGYGVADGVNTVTLSGSGNAVTGASISGHTLTLTKGTTFSVSGHTHTFASLTSKPTTIAGYGITDAYTKAQVDSTIAKYLPLAGGTITGALTVNGIATFKSKVAIGDIYIINDGSGNLYVQKTDGKTAANFYATGGITAFGASSVSGGTGSGLNGSVLGFEKATAMTSADNGDSSKTEVSFLATAWSIKQLNDKINAFGTGVFSDYLTIAAAKATYQPKGSYLTSHQTIYGLTIQKNGTSLGTYTPNSAAKTINVTVPTKLSELSNDSGYTKNTGTVTSVAISVPTGLSVSGSPITTNGTIAIALASGYSIPTTAKQTAWDGAVSAKHTHSNKSVLDGISSTKVSHWNSAYDWYALMTTDEETADGIINKWNEVVSFLANIAQTDTLSGIVDGINKSISDEVARAKKAEGVNASGISANKGSIATLQGYFTNGSAKKALQLTNARKLWGNSFNGTADINGSIIVPSGKYISIGNIKLEYDAANKALKITNTTTNEVANLYTSGGVSAYGVGTSSSSGGGLNGSVKSYSDALKLTSESLSEVASAYSIKALDSRISSLEGGSATSIETTGSGNAVTSVSKSGTKITFTKGSTFSLNGHTHTFASLTSKPTSLSGYGITDGVNAVSVTGSGNAVTAASVSGHTLTLTKGSTFSLSNHTHYVGTTQVQGSSAEQALTGITKIDNILKLSKATVTVNTSYKAEQNRLVIYGNTYGNDANYIKSARKLSYGDGGPQLVFSTNENPDASGVQSAALVYTDHDTIGAGVSLSFVTNQGDAYFIAPHIKALTAFQGNLAWSYITNKPTTLSGFGITDGLRSVTHPSGSNVFVTGISTSGTAITYTKSYTKKSLSAVGTSGWTNASIDGNIIPDMSFIAYWNGAYSGTSSNLAYCNKGAFGSFAIKNSLAFSELTSKPTTISGYGITDAYTKSQVDAIAAKYLPLTGGTLTGQLKIVASALNGAYNGLLIGDDCYIGDCNFGNTIGLMGVGNNNAGMVKFGKGGMQFGYNGSNHIASTTAQWTNLNADLLDGWHKDNIVWSGAVNSNTASLSHYWAKLFDITVTGNQYDDRSFTFLFSNGYNDTYSVVVLRIRQNGAKDSGAYNFSISLRELVGNMSSRLRVYYNNATGNVQLWGNCQGQYGSLSYTIIKKTGRTSADFTSQGTLVTNTSFSEAQSLPATTGDSPYTLLDGATRIGIVKQADQLVTARSLWGQSFNGTANVSGNMTGVGNINTSAAPAGTIYTNNWFRSKGSTGWYSEDHGGGWYMIDNTWIRSYGGKDVYLSNKLSVNGNVGIGTSVPSHKLHVLGEIYTTTKVNINGIILEKDSNGDLKVNGNLYATGGISAYGTSSAGSGGGLNGSVKSYADALKLASESLSEIASAYSIKQLSTRITSLEGGSATSISVSGSGNAVTSITKNGTTITVTKGATFLTAHQSLSAYMKTADAKSLFLYHTRENIVTDLDDFNTKGASHIYEMKDVTNTPTDNYWLQVMNWGSADADYGMLLANDYSINGSLYFRHKVAGKWNAWKTLIDSSNIANQSVKYATTAGTAKNPNALSWSGYASGSYDGSVAKSISIPNNTNQLTNGAGFITASASITGNAATATKVNHSLSVFGKSFNGSADVTVADTDLIASISTATANLTDKTEILTSYASDNGFNDSNAKNRIYRRPASAIWGYINSKTISNADKLDNVHLNGIFTALSNTNNGVSMTIGTVAKSLANMQVYSATKLATARNIALGHDFRGSANFDGTGNITINGHINAAIISLGPTDPSPFKRIAHVQVSGSWNDNALLLYLSQGYIGGFFGICRVEFRINDVSEAGSASASVKWLFRHGYATDYVQVGFYSAKHNSYMDVFVKTTGGYQGTVIRCLQDSRGSINSNVSLLKATATTEAYTSIEAAATALYKLAYTAIVKGSDAGAVNYANSAGNAGTLDGIHANELFTNLSNSGNNLSITIGGTNKTLTVKYAASAGNADTLDGVHASGLFTNLSNSGNNISITIGGTNKTLTAAYATNCDTVDGYHAGTSVKPYGTIPVIGTNGVIELGHYIDFHHDNTTGSDYSVRLQTDGNHSNVVTLPTATGTLALTSDNVASATKLQTTRTLWGQSFNGTANISGSMTGVGDMTLDAGARIKHGSGNLYIGNSDNSNWIGVQNICSQSSIGDGNWSLRTSGAAHFKDTTINGTATIKNLLSLVDGSHKGLKMGSTYISSLDGEVILQGNTALRFGNDAWDYNQWAGLKYDHSSKTVYLGIADGSIFKANSAQSGGVINLKQGISSVYTPALYAGGDIYHTGVYRMLWKNSKASKYLNVMNISQDDNGILTIGYGNFSNNKNVVLEGYNLNFRVGNDSGMKSMWLNYNNGNPVLSLDGNFYATGGVTAYKSSDERLKHDIHGVDSLAIIKAMGGTVAFRYNADNKDSIGWIAQRVLHNTFMQDLVEKDDKGFLKINYWSPKLIAVAFGAIEQVDDEVSRLKARVVFLESEVQRLSGKQDGNNKKRLDNKNINLLN